MRRLALAVLATLWAAGSAKAAVEIPGWIHMATGDDYEAYYQAAEPTPDGYRQIRVRFEDDPARAGSFHSGVQLLLVDCAGKRTRRMEGEAYTLPGLSGEVAKATPAADWSPVDPQTIEGLAVEVACA